MIAHIGDARVQSGARIQHHRHQIRRKFDVDIIQVQHITQDLFGWHVLCRVARDVFFVWVLLTLEHNVGHGP